MMDEDNNDDDDDDGDLDKTVNGEKENNNKNVDSTSKNGFKNDDKSFKVPNTVGLLNDSVSSTKCEVSQTSVGLGSESVLESSILSGVGGLGGREETDSAAGSNCVLPLPVANNFVTSSSSSSSSATDVSVVVNPPAKELKLTEANAALIGQQPPIESLNVKQVRGYLINYLKPVFVNINSLK